MILVKELKNRIIRELEGLYPDRERISLAEILIQNFTGLDKNRIISEPELKLDDHDETIILQKLDELKQHKPVQYVSGKAFFYDFELEVSPAVLIPRPETEELVNWLSDDYEFVSGLRILDIGTGSGCIIISLGKILKDNYLAAVDISEEALAIAGRNANNLSVPVDLIKMDILDEGQWEQAGKFDVIISNPPYVRESEKQVMNANVLDYEPHKALFVPDEDPLLFYKAISGFSKKHLQPGGALYLEINENLGREIVDLLNNEGFGKVTLKKDMQGKDRMVKALWY